MWWIARKILNATDEQHEIVVGEKMLVKKWKDHWIWRQSWSAAGKNWITARAVHGSGLCPTRTRPDFIGWEKSLTRNRPGQSFGSVGSGRIGFGSVSVGFGFAGVERNLTGFWPKCGRISLDLVRSNKIWPIFSYNYKDRAEILMDLAEICLYRRT